MPRCSAFNSTHFSSRPSHAETIYKQMVANLGGEKNFSTDFDSPAMARVYANAMAFARARYTLERAGKQFRPDRILELLPVAEREYGIVPAADATIEERRRDLAAAMGIPRGAVRTNVEYVLGLVLGDDFVSCITTEADDAVLTSADPGADGIYVPAGTGRSVFRLSESVLFIGDPVTVAYEAVGGAASTLVVGEKFFIDGGNIGRREVVTVDAVGDGTFTATFQYPHTSGVLLATGRYPYLMSSKRHDLFVLSAEGAVSPRVRRRAHRAIRKLLRGVSTWSLADDSGPFKVGVGRLGVTTIGAV